MMVCNYIAAWCALAAPPADSGGIIEGVVVNGSRLRAPVAGIVVVLRAGDRGPLLVVDQTSTDDQGRFRFENLPLSANGPVFLPGANHLGIHYPGARVRLQAERSSNVQMIVVYDTQSSPSPLVAARHEIELRAGTGVLTVTEKIAIANRSRFSYVGKAADADESPVTLRLSIPAEFDKVTFQKEFFGREFHLNQRVLETSIPWTPGEHQLEFAYRLPLESRFLTIRRTLDLPTQCARVTVVRGTIGDVQCNLPSAPAASQGVVTFETRGEGLDGGYVLEIAIGNLPVPWTHYARWVALAILVLMAACTYLIARRLRSAACDKPQARTSLRSKAA